MQIKTLIYISIFLMVISMSLNYYINYYIVKANNANDNKTNQFVKECVSLPIYPELTDSEVERVVEVIKHYYSD